MKDYRDSAYFGQVQGRVWVNMKSGLSIIKGVIPEFTPEPGITWIITAFNSFEKRFKGEVYTNHDILEDLTMNCVEFRVLVFPGFKEISHFKISDGDMVIFPGEFTEVYRGVIDKTTDVQGFIKPCDVGFFREESVLESFQHNI